MWSIVWYVITFIGGAFFTFCIFALCSISGKESDAEGKRAYERLVRLARHKAQKAKEEIEELERKYQVSFVEFEESIDQDEKLKDYAKWLFWRQMLEQAKRDI